MKFRAKVIPSGNATGVEVPKKIVEALRSGARPPITVTINGHTWRSRVAVMRGRRLVGISAANRAASGIAEGTTVTVDLRLDTAPRVVAQPPDLAAALRRKAGANAAFERLPFGLKRKHVAAIERAKTPGDSTAEDRESGWNAGGKGVKQEGEGDGDPWPSSAS